MAIFCLPKPITDKFKAGLKSGEIDPAKLSNMSSEDRNKFLGKFVGENNATHVNSVFESKLLLKNQQRGMLTWAKQVSGITPAARRDIVKKIENMQEILDPGQEKQFMRDLTATRLGTNVTEDEAKVIADMSKKVTEYEAKRNADKTFPTEIDRMNYGRAVEDLTQYVGDLKVRAEKLRPGDLRAPVPTFGRIANKTAGNLKSLSASMDNSSIFRQGWKTLITNPTIWSKNAAKTFSTLAKTVRGKNIMREVNADIISRPTYDQMIKAKLAIKNPEEAFPESMAEKVPALGRLYKASESAYTGFVYKTRADVFDKLLKTAEKSGVDIGDKKELEAIGKLVNSLTGRGNLGKIEPIANTVNNVFFSPRFLKSNIDVLTVHALDRGITPFARRQAAINLLKIVSATAGVLATANALMPGSVEFDPRSSDFGKIRVGDTRFDMTGGMSSIVTLASRLIDGHSKSAGTGKITDLRDAKFGQKNAQDIIYDFFENKLSPAASVLANLNRGTDRTGNKTDPLKEAGKAVTPIGIQTTIEATKNPNAADPLLVAIADGLGLSANTYSAAGGGGVSTWEKSDAKKVTAFKDAVGEDKFNEAAKEYDESYNTWITNVMKKEEYQNLPEGEKSSLITQKKTKLQSDIMKKHGFKYKTVSKKKKSKLLN